MKIVANSQQVNMSIGILTVYFQIPGCRSLKQKRSVIKPMIANIQREFQVSISEIAFQDKWQSCFLACVNVSNEPKFLHSFFQNIYHYILSRYPQIVIIDHQIELV